MSESLYQLSAEFQTLLQLGETDDPEEVAAFNDTVDSLLAVIDKKVDGYCAIMSRFDAQTAAIDAEIDRLKTRKKVVENRQKYMKEALLNCMVATERKEIKTDLHTIKIVKNGGRLPLIVNEEEVPENFKKITVSTDNDLIRKHLDAGEELSFAYLGERGIGLRIK